MKNKETIIQFVYALIYIAKTKDIDQIRVKELCQTAYISRSTFYQYFTDINDMIECLEYYLINKSHQATIQKQNMPCGFTAGFPILIDIKTLSIHY